MVRQEKFGSDVGLMHEMIVTGRKVNADVDFYAALAHDQELFAQVVKMVVGPFPGYVYDAKKVSRFLRLDCHCYELLPRIEENKIIFFYGGWSLRQLLDSPEVQFQVASETRDYHFVDTKYKSGYYSISFRYPGSNDKQWNAQVSGLDLGIDEMPTVIALSAAIVHSLACRETSAGNGDPLRGHWGRCKEAIEGKYHSSLRCVDGRFAIEPRNDSDATHKLWMIAGTNLND